MTGCAGWSQTTHPNADMQSWRLLTFNGESFGIVGWLKPAQASQSALRIYIEGDGFAWAYADQPSDDPTPANGVGRQLALADAEVNVLYLARPCQYAARQHQGCYDQRWWTSHRYHRQVIDHYHAILDSLRQGKAASRFELVGYSGGAAIAVILAAERQDVQNVRTVAGNLDSVFVNQLHQATAMPESLNPLQFASLLLQPQLHFVGRQDSVVPAIVSQRFMQRQTDGCSRQIMVNANHWQGWQAAWLNLLQADFPACHVK